MIVSKRSRERETRQAEGSRTNLKLTEHPRSAPYSLRNSRGRATRIPPLEILDVEPEAQVLLAERLPHVLPEQTPERGLFEDAVELRGVRVFDRRRVRR